MIDLQPKCNHGMSDFSLSEILADAELSAEIEKWAAPVLIKEGEILFQQGEAPSHAFFVKTGEIALTMNMSGRALWRVRATNGSLVGLPAIVTGEPYSMTAIAACDTQVYKISRDDFRKLTEQNPQLCCNILQILAGDVHVARRALSRSIVGPSKQMP
jgi:CRP-like cAMP-binding protein